jgi:hypothetical protein
MSLHRNEGKFLLAGGFALIRKANVKRKISGSGIKNSHSAKIKKAATGF